jgi:hypothetical protein
MKILGKINNKKGDETRISLGEKENEKVKEQSNPNTNVFNLTNELNKIKVPIPFNEIVKIPTFKNDLENFMSVSSPQPI